MPRINGRCRLKLLGICKSQANLCLLWEEAGDINKLPRRRYSCFTLCRSETQPCCPRYLVLQAERFLQHWQSMLWGLPLKDIYRHEIHVAICISCRIANGQSHDLALGNLPSWLLWDPSKHPSGFDEAWSFCGHACSIMTHLESALVGFWNLLLTGKEICCLSDKARSGLKSFMGTKLSWVACLLQGKPSMSISYVSLWTEFTTQPLSKVNLQQTPGHDKEDR